MDFQIHYLVVLFCSPLFAFISHLTFARLVSLLKLKPSPLLIAALGVLLGYFVGGIIVWRTMLESMANNSDRFWAALYGTLVYGGLAFSYFQFFAMTETARRIRILYELKLCGKTTRNEIESRYGAENMLSLRLERLIAWKQLRCADDRYLLKGRALYYIARIIEAWAKLLGFSTGGTK